MALRQVLEENLNADQLQHTLARQDPATDAKSARAPAIPKEVQGYLFSISFKKPVEFMSYEIFEVVEAVVKAEIEEITFLHDPISKLIIEAIVQLTEEISASRLKGLHLHKFKGSKMRLRLFSNEETFLSYLENRSNDKLSKISLPLPQSTPVVYVQGFNGSEQELHRFFSRCGMINFIHRNESSNLKFDMIFFNSNAAAQKAFRTFNGIISKYGDLIVNPFYKKAEERAFAVVNCTDLKSLDSFVSNIGSVESKKIDKNTVYYLMDSIESSSLLCVLLNSRKIGDNHLLTYFVDFEHFHKITPTK